MSILLRGSKDVDELKAKYDYYYAEKDRPCVRAARKIIEGYFLSGTVSEDRFLEVCDDMDDNLYDDYKDLYEDEPWFINLQHYTEELQRITGKKPSKRNRKWLHLKIQTEQDAQ